MQAEQKIGLQQAQAGPTLTSKNCSIRSLTKIKQHNKGRNKAAQEVFNSSLQVQELLKQVSINDDVHQ